SSDVSPKSLGPVPNSCRKLLSKTFVDCRSWYLAEFRQQFATKVFDKRLESGSLEAFSENLCRKLPSKHSATHCHSGLLVFSRPSAPEMFCRNPKLFDRSGRQSFRRSFQKIARQ